MLTKPTKAAVRAGGKVNKNKQKAIGEIIIDGFFCISTPLITHNELMFT